MQKPRFTLSEHAEQRITERMGLSHKAVLEYLRNNAFFTLHITVSEPRLKYIVMWDEIKKKPFFLVLTQIEEGWEVKTTLETFPFCRRKHNVMILPSHIGFARALNHQYRMSLPALHYRIYVIVRKRDKDGIQFKIQREPLTNIPASEYEKLYGNITSFLSQYARCAEIKVPSASLVDIEVVGIIDGEKKVIESLNLQSTLW